MGIDYRHLPLLMSSEVTPEKRAASSHSSSDYDAEKAKTSAGKTNVNPVNFNDGINRDLPIVRKLWAAVQWLDRFGVEARGVERVPEDERHHHRVADAGFMWGSANWPPSNDHGPLCVWLQHLVPYPAQLHRVRWLVHYQLDRGRLGASCRQQRPPSARGGRHRHHRRHHSGSRPLRLRIRPLFRAVGQPPCDHHLLDPFGTNSPWAQGGFGPLTGRDEAGAVLSFGAAIAGFALGWTSLAGDYTVNFPVETPSTKVFAYTYIGLNFPLILVETFGAVAFASLANKDTWQEAYDTYGVGGLLGAPLYGPIGGFGRLLLVILALSIVANNIPNVYSFALSVQALHKYFQLIPRCFLSVLCTGIYIALAIPGADHFESWLDTMLVILSYWLAIYTVLLIEEHYIFRGGKFSNWNLEASYNDFSKLPPGWAAAIAVIAGVAGAVLGMAQEWYVGVIGGMITMPFGGDIGFLLSFSFAGIIYPPVRYLERRIHGR